MFYRVTVSVLFVSEAQFSIELAAPYTLANNSELIPTTHCHLSSLKHPFFSMARIASSVNTWCYGHVPYEVIRKCGVIRQLAGGNCRTFRRVIQRYCFHRYLCFHCVFFIWFFVYCEWLKFRGVPIFVVFMEGPIHEFQYPQNFNFCMLYESKYRVHEFWTSRMCHFFYPRKLVPT